MGSWENNVLAHVYDCPSCVSDPMYSDDYDDEDDDFDYEDY